MIFWIFRKLGEGMGRKNGKKMTYNYQFQSVTLYISGTVDHIMKFLVHRCKIMIPPGVFIYF